MGDDQIKLRDHGGVSGVQPVLHKLLGLGVGPVGLEAVLQKLELILVLACRQYIRHALGALLGYGGAVADEQKIGDLLAGFQVFRVEVKQVFAHHVADAFVIAHDLAGHALEILDQAVIDDQRDLFVNDTLGGVAQLVAFKRPKHDGIRPPGQDFIELFDLLGSLAAYTHHIIADHTGSF